MAATYRIYARKTDPNVELPRGPNGPGVARTTEYRRWRGIMSRCLDESNPSYRYYGGRGIQVCERWRKSFFAFLGDMGHAPKGLTIERIDNNGDYEPGNCRWATYLEQGRNRRNNRMLKFNGKRFTVADICRKLGVPHSTIRMRLSAGWSETKALNTPIKKITRNPRRHAGSTRTDGCSNATMQGL